MAAMWREKLSKNWLTHPKLRHNLWTVFDEEPDKTYLTVSHGTFEVPTQEAQTFLKMRRYCTGHNSVDAIIGKSRLNADCVRDILDSLAKADIFRPPYRGFHEMSDEERRSVLFDACRIWAEQMAETTLAVEIRSGDVPRSVVVGWLLETYHYIKTFPETIAYAARHADGQLREVLEAYASQERGHEAYVVRCLRALGFGDAEIDGSIPLVSTRLIDLLMRELFARTPMAALLVAAIVEADDLSDDEADSFRSAVARNYGFDADTLLPLQEHMMIDARLGHAELARRNAHLITVRDEDELHHLVNALHDIKHAFDLQKLEIMEYYSKSGNYIPRQFVDFFAV